MYVPHELYAYTQFIISVRLHDGIKSVSHLDPPKPCAHTHSPPGLDAERYPCAHAPLVALPGDVDGDDVDDVPVPVGAIAFERARSPIAVAVSIARSCRRSARGKLAGPLPLQGPRAMDAVSSTTTTTSEVTRANAVRIILDADPTSSVSLVVGIA
jgi:hypothetical protein